MKKRAERIPPRPAKTPALAEQSAPPPQRVILLPLGCEFKQLSNWGGFGVPGPERLGVRADPTS
jgi:hypothetical protein